MVSENADDKSLDKYEKDLAKLGNFEVASCLVKLAEKNSTNSPVLNAGRGNPNWIQTVSRLAFCRLVEFGVKESRRTINGKDLAGYTEKEGMAKRLRSFLSDSPADLFLSKALDYGEVNLGFNGDEFAAELVNGVLGNDYPMPSRVLNCTQTVINHYLASILYAGHDVKKLIDTTQLFPTEGATAAIAYIFNSLKENHLIAPGDKIILNTPIFSPYLAIPQLNDYRLKTIDLKSIESDHWQLKAEAVEALNDSEVKALILVNPSNPGSVALSTPTLEALKDAVKKNPHLMVITDDVYSTFASEFSSVYNVIPYNTLLVYSYSKLYGVTGWRLGVLGINESNVFDELIANLPKRQKEEVDKRYAHDSMDPENMKFIDRIVADSRSIGLYHTAGLSTPQQIMEDLFSLAHLVNIAQGDKDYYIKEACDLVDARYASLNKALGIEDFNNSRNTKYYSLVDVYAIAEKHYGKEFSSWLATHFDRLDFLYKLASRYGVVLMDGVGFGSNRGIVRVSEANLPDAAYPQIGEKVRKLLEDYFEQWKEEK